MNIKEIITEKTIKINLEANDKTDLLKKMINLISNSNLLKDKNDAEKEIFTRESIMSTGVGKGIALPHAKTNSVDGSVGAVAVLKKPVHFDSFDGKPVDVVFMLLGRESDVTNHLRLLSKISRVMNNDAIKQEILNSKSELELLKIFQRVDENI